MKFISTLIFLFSSLFIFAQTISTDRPTQTTGPTTVPKGVFQLETGGLYTSSGTSNGVLQAPVNLFRLGVGEGFEIRLVNGMSFTRSNYYTSPYYYENKIRASFNNFELGFKAQLLNKEDKKTQIGIIAHGFTSTGLNKFDNNEKGGLMLFAFNHQMNDKNGLSYNLGYQVVFMEPTNNVTQNAIYTLNYTHSMTERLGIFTEVYGNLPDLENFDEDNISLNFNAGCTYLIKDFLQLDYSFGFGITDRMNYQSLGLSFFIAPKNK